MLSCLPGSVVHWKHQHIQCIESLEKKCLQEKEDSEVGGGVVREPKAKPCPPFRVKIVASPICC